MSNINEFRAYVKSLNENLALGNATEHTHRSALKTLIESVHGGITATNEPKRDRVRCAGPVTSPPVLAKRMAQPTHMIRDIVSRALNRGYASADLRDLYRATRGVLVPDLTYETFADMFAQTLAYGLFAARVNHEAGTFGRLNPATRIPRTNPFVRRIFDMIGGTTLEDEPFVSFVDDLAQLLSIADMETILAGFGQQMVGSDPVLHFYEDFLAAYDFELKVKRGVYYTPEPVVSYIVRSVDHILRERFDCREGLADCGMTTYETLNPCPHRPPHPRGVPLRGGSPAHDLLTRGFGYALI